MVRLGVAWRGKDGAPLRDERRFYFSEREIPAEQIPGPLQVYSRRLQVYSTGESKNVQSRSAGISYTDRRRRAEAPAKGCVTSRAAR